VLELQPTARDIRWVDWLHWVHCSSMCIRFAVWPFCSAGSVALLVLNHLKQRMGSREMELWEHQNPSHHRLPHFATFPYLLMVIRMKSCAWGPYTDIYTLRMSVVLSTVHLTSVFDILHFHST